jgi:aspartate ammonia-lyase
VERDSFDAIELPNDCLYGVRTARCVANTNVGSAQLSSYPELVRSLAVVKRACALANSDCGLLDKRLAELIVAACDDVLSGSFDQHFPVDMLHGGGYIGFNLNINEVVANLANIKAGSEPGSYKPVCPKIHVNLNQSTADTCATAGRLAIIERWSSLSESFGRLKASLIGLREKFADVRTVARTCLMDAMPVSVGENFGAWAAFVERRHDALNSAIYDLHRVNLGGTVIGSGSGASQEYRKCVVSFLNQSSEKRISSRSNLYDAAQNIDDLANVSAQLRITADGLIKIAGDIRMLASGPNCGLGELKLPAVQEGSSFFSGKVNPVIPETLMQVCMQIFGFDRAAQAAMEHGELNLNVFEVVALKNILDAQKLLDRAVLLFEEKCIQGLDVDVDRCKQHLQALELNSWAPPHR